MREALRRLWWVCLAAAVARVAVAPVVVTSEAGQGQCEVLDLNLQHPQYPLPTNLTFRPSVAGWQLNFILRAGQAEEAACVRLEEKESRLRLLLFQGDCDEGVMKDYNYLGDALATHRAWTSLGVDVTDDTVLVTAPGGRNTSLKGDNMLLPRGGLQVAAGRGVEAAVGCRVSCPAYRHASPGPDKKIIVRSWSEGSVQFYFLPGSAFVKLEYEVMCKTTLGNKVFHPIADIAPSSHLPRGLWHLVHLQHSSSVVTVHLNNKQLEEKELPDSCTFIEHIIKVKGDGLFSFTCNPYSGEAKEREAEGDSTACPTTTTHAALHPGLVVLYTVIAEVLLSVVVYGVWFAYNELQQIITSKQQEKPQKN